MQQQSNREIDRAKWETQEDHIYHEKDKNLYRFIKRAFDVIFSLFLLVVTSPILLLVMILVKLESPGGIFYKQERVGLNGKKFDVIKIRSMRIDAEKNGPQWASENDPRITKIGMFIRQTRIDELPQIFNVLKGDMAIIGPRPEREIFIKKFKSEIPNFGDRLLVKPGLTGWAQVNGGYDITVAKKFEFDMFYIENESIKLDSEIFLKTIQVVLTGNGAR